MLPQHDRPILAKLFQESLLLELIAYSAGCLENNCVDQSLDCSRKV
jgi:hypothetical protein